MRKPESDVEKAALKWWKEKRPLAWNAAKHRRNPDINTSNDAEAALANAVAASLRSGSGGQPPKHKERTVATHTYTSEQRCYWRRRRGGRMTNAFSV